MSALRHVGILVAGLTAGCTTTAFNAPHPGAAPDSHWSGAQRRIDLQLDQGSISLAQERSSIDLRGWVDRASQAIRAYYGRFPVQHTQLTVERVSGAGVLWARTFAQSGAHVRIGVGQQTSPGQFSSDWMLTHEFVHLALPQLPDEHDWLQEGAATYVEPIARARAGQLSASQVWAEFAREMPRGLPGMHDKGLDHTTSWARVYWGGALFFLMADVEIRKRTDNNYGLEHALRAILDEGGTLDQRWTIREALAIGDRATGVPVLTELYERWGTNPVKVDLAALWRDLGVEPGGTRAMLNEEAPLAPIRRAITAEELVLVSR